VDVLGVPLALTDYERTLDWMDATVAAGGRGYVCVAATHTVMACQEDPELRAAVLASDLTVPDGQPLVWAMNALGHDLSHRVYGPSSWLARSSAPPAPARACTSTAAATRARSSSSPSTCAGGIPACGSSAATRPRSVR
jgi:hypothetical protein